MKKSFLGAQPYASMLVGQYGLNIFRRTAHHFKLPVSGVEPRCIARNPHAAFRVAQESMDLLSGPVVGRAEVFQVSGGHIQPEQTFALGPDPDFFIMETGDGGHRPQVPIRNHKFHFPGFGIDPAESSIVHADPYTAVFVRNEEAHNLVRQPFLQADPGDGFFIAFPADYIDPPVGSAPDVSKRVDGHVVNLVPAQSIVLSKVIEALPFQAIQTFPIGGKPKITRRVLGHGCHSHSRQAFFRLP
ncbi:MAG: hypothetical protein IPG32_02695 [Saprospirales bacterium]|nr:hypothetical protein [Saprospirales bacterium]